METQNPVFYGRKRTTMGCKVVKVNPDSEVVGEEVELDKEGGVDGGDEDLQEDAIDEVPEEGRGKTGAENHLPRSNHGGDVGISSRVMED